METKRITDTGFVSSRPPFPQKSQKNPQCGNLRQNPGKRPEKPKPRKTRNRKRRKHQRIRIFGITHEATHSHLPPPHGRGNPCQLPPHRVALPFAEPPTHTPSAPSVSLDSLVSLSLPWANGSDSFCRRRLAALCAHCLHVGRSGQTRGRIRGGAPIRPAGGGDGRDVGEPRFCGTRRLRRTSRHPSHHSSFHSIELHQ